MAFNGREGSTPSFRTNSNDGLIFMPPLRNILLVNPWIFDFTAYDFWMRPLGLLSIGAVIKQIPGVRVDMAPISDRK